MHGNTVLSRKSRCLVEHHGKGDVLVSTRLFLEVSMLYEDTNYCSDLSPY